MELYQERRGIFKDMEILGYRSCRYPLRTAIERNYI